MAKIRVKSTFSDSLRGGACGTRISVSQKEIISKQVKRYRNTAMSKGDIIRAVKTVYGYDQEAVEELVNEVW